MPAQEKLSSTEQYLAYVAGFGIVVIITALILLGLGTFDEDDIPISLLLVGLAALIIGTGGWLMMVKPWLNFDDLQTPHYTGHAEHAEPVPADHALIPAPPAAIEPVDAEPAAIQPVEPEPAAFEAVAAEPAAIELPAPEPEAVPAGMSLVPPEPAAVEAAVDAATVPPEDDLLILEGIGPQSAAALRAVGITTYAQVAQLSPADLDRIMKEQGVKLVGTTAHWPRQAEIAASGDLTALDEYMQRLRGQVVENDLTLLEGIGPKSAAALRAAGIATFAQVAQMTPVELEKIIRDQKVRLVGSTATWPEQAALAAAGDLTGLEALRARIKRGGALSV